MSQPITKKKFVPGSLSRPRTARTLLLRMAADEARAERIRQTYEQRKAENPREFTWRRLADHVGISERAVQDWAKTGGLEYANAEKAAEFWQVDFDWLWRGPQDDRQTPDPFGAARASQVDDGFDEFRQYVRDIRRDIADASSEAHEEREGIRELLATQTGILSKIAELIEQQESILAKIQQAADGLPADETTQALTESMRDLADRVEAEQAARDAAASTPAGTRRQRATGQ